MLFEIRNSKFEIRNLHCKGFSLVELLVVIAIIAILAVSATAGLGLLGNILKVRQVTGIMGDIIKQEDLKVLRGDFEKATIHFLSDYIVIEEMPKDVDLDFRFEKDPICTEKGYEYKLNYKNDANLINKDENGETIDARVVKKDDHDCI